MRRGLMREDFSVETELSSEQVEFMLRGCKWLVEKKKLGRKERADGGPKFVVMTGIVRNSWRPIWTLTLRENGCGIEVRARCGLYTRIFMFVWFGMLAFYTLVALASVIVEHRWTLFLACLGLWAFGLGMCALGFWLPEREAKKRLGELLPGALK